MASVLFVFALFVGVCFGVSVSPHRNLTRIVGGNPATIQQYPSAVQISSYYYPSSTWHQYCGGSILTQNIVLTAAHCFDLDIHPVEFYSIRAGATLRDRGGEIFQFSHILPHPAYGVYEIALDADIAIGRLWNLLSFGPNINAIAIMPQGFVIPGNSPGIYAGWGASYEDDAILRHVDVNIVSHEECERRYGGPIHRDVVCAGYDGKDACVGDSGGPLYYQGILAGTVAWGPVPCGHPYHPGATMGTAYYSDWIVANAS